MSWIVAVSLAGVELDLDGVLADVTVRHGRDAVDDGPIASSASLALWPVTRALTRAFRVGVTLTITGSGPGDEWPLFAGVVSDASLDGDTLSLLAAGRLATANRLPIDISAWPAEPWSARAARLFGYAGVAYIVEPDPDFDPILEPPTGVFATDAELFETYAPSLAAAVGAAVLDTPDGRLLAQAIGSRSSRGYAVHELDPAIVAYAPAWLQPLDVVNELNVQYGPDSATLDARVTDGASVELYGGRAGAIETTRIRDEADAMTRGRVALSRGAYPRWSMRNALLLEPIPNLAVGDRVLLSGLPASAPTEVWQPVVEGWTHTIAGGDWRLELALSDPLASGLAVTWAELTPDSLVTWARSGPGQWADVSGPWDAYAPTEGMWANTPPLEWREADELGDFYP